MKRKYFVLLAGLAVILALNGCSKQAEEPEEQTEETEETNIANPVVSYESLDEINEVAGTNLVTPGVMGVENESYSVISGTIAEYKFSINGIDYVFRASQETDDISGVYSNGGLLLDSMDEDGYAADDDGKIICWTISADDTDVQYVLYAQDKGTMEEQTFKDIAAELQDDVVNLTMGVDNEEDTLAAFYDYISGDYMDETSGRASAAIVSNGDSVTITIHWADSAFDYVEWTMTATHDAEHSLVYSDCTKKHVSSKDDGTSEEEVLSENESGYFDFDADGKLAWTGAAEENCQTCVFVKNAE